MQGSYFAFSGMDVGNNLRKIITIILDTFFVVVLFFKQTNKQEHQ